jgi:hypothetical protein
VTIIVIAWREDIYEDSNRKKVKSFRARASATTTAVETFGTAIKKSWTNLHLQNLYEIKSDNY